MNQTYEQWEQREAINSVLAEYPVNTVEEMAKRIVQLEQEVEELQQRLSNQVSGMEYDW